MIKHSPAPRPEVCDHRRRILERQRQPDVLGSIDKDKGLQIILTVYISIVQILSDFAQ